MNTLICGRYQDIPDMRKCRSSNRFPKAMDKAETSSDTDLTDYAALMGQLHLQAGIPYTPNWSAAADFLQIIVDYCLETKPATVFECSSGLTTLMLARCCQLSGRGRVISLEDGEDFAGKIREHLKGYGLISYASVIHASLRQTLLDEVEYAWYDTRTIPDTRIEMLVIDGPSGFLQKNSRYPALPLLYTRLADGCRVFLDDAARPDEREIVELWLNRFPSIEVERVTASRGCAMLTIRK